jgi:hypothetical protein
VTVMTEVPPEDRQRVSVRRSPRLSAFVLVFGVLGFFGTLVVTGLYPSDPSVGFATLFAYFALYGITGTIAVGIILWLLLDIRSRRRARNVDMGRETKSDTS